MAWVVLGALNDETKILASDPSDASEPSDPSAASAARRRLALLVAALGAARGAGEGLLRGGQILRQVLHLDAPGGGGGGEGVGGDGGLRGEVEGRQ